MPNNEALWYVIHTYSGYENKVAENIQRMVETRGLQDLIFETKIPTEIVVDSQEEADGYVDSSSNENETKEKKVSEPKAVEHKLFPSYVLVKMVMTDESWYIVRNTRGVTGFVGPASKPVPLTDEEIAALGMETHVTEVAYAEGDSVQIVAGPLEGFIGIVNSVDIPGNCVCVTVSMFGRETPVELELNQAKLVD